MPLSLPYFGRDFCVVGRAHDQNSMQAFVRLLDLSAYGDHLVWPIFIVATPLEYPRNLPFRHALIWTRDVDTMLF
jgi:hypothetical protein